jgi:hypothetical protein
MTRTIGVAMLLAGVSVGCLGAAAQAQAPEGDQLDPAVRRDLVIWAQRTPAGHRLMARRILENGRPQRGSAGMWPATGPTQADGTTGDQRWPMLLDSFLVWSERQPGRFDYDVFMQELDVHDRPTGRPIVVDDSPSEQRHPSLGGVCGELLVLWADDRRDDGDILGRWYNSADLQPRGPAVWLVDSPGHADEPFTDLGLLDKHELRILFTDDRNGSLDIYSTVIRDDSKAPVNPRANQEPVITGPLDDYSPRVAQSTAGQDLLIWTADTLDDGPDVMGQRYIQQWPRGNRMVIAGGRGVQTAPALSHFLDRGWLTAWSEDTGGGNRVLFAEVRSNGLMAGPRFTVTGDSMP